MNRFSVLTIVLRAGHELQPIDTDTLRGRRDEILGAGPDDF
jgi:hypothetical protein